MSMLISETVESDAEPIGEESKQIFRQKVVKTFETFYQGDDLQEHLMRIHEFADDEQAIINYIYGALLAANLDLSAFIEATGLLETSEER